MTKEQKEILIQILKRAKEVQIEELYHHFLLDYNVNDIKVVEEKLDLLIKLME